MPSASLSSKMISNDSKHSPGVTATTPYLPSSNVIGTTEAERRLRWKIDLYIVPIVALLYALCTIDRVNIGNARLAGLERTLNLHGNDFNALLSIFYVSYILFSVPATWVTKWIGPGWVLPGTTLIFGTLTVSFAFVKAGFQEMQNMERKAFADDGMADVRTSSSCAVSSGNL
jgi:hypothetical protein